MANILMLVSLLMMALFGVCFGAIYEVGDSSGWTNKGVDYNLWASYRNFTVGDYLHFKYVRGEDNVLRVLHEGFKSCKNKHEIYNLRSGDDYVPLNRPGNFFFISEEHCFSGQKIHVNVANKPTPSLSPATAPTPLSIPSSSPIATPAATPKAAPEASPSATPKGSPYVAPQGAPFAAPQGAPVVAPKVSPFAAPKASPFIAPEGSPFAAPQGSPSASPKGSPVAAPASSPMVASPPAPSEDFPPEAPFVLTPAPNASPDQPKKSSAHFVKFSSMPFLMAMAFVVFIMV